MPRWSAVAALVILLCAASLAQADHIPGRPCNDCASHEHWPKIDGVIKAATDGKRRLVGTGRSDELLGQHGSDTLLGRGSSDVLWGDSRPSGQPARQRDRIYGGRGGDFIYASHGRNRIYGGAGNDAISAHFGRGLIDWPRARHPPRGPLAPGRVARAQLRKSRLPQRAPAWRGPRAAEVIGEVSDGRARSQTA